MGSQQTVHSAVGFMPASRSDHRVFLSGVLLLMFVFFAKALILGEFLQLRVRARHQTRHSVMTMAATWATTTHLVQHKRLQNVVIPVVATVVVTQVRDSVERILKTRVREKRSAICNRAEFANAVLELGGLSFCQSRFGDAVREAFRKTVRVDGLAVQDCCRVPLTCRHVARAVQPHCRHALLVDAHNAFTLHRAGKLIYITCRINRHKQEKKKRRIGQFEKKPPTSLYPRETRNCRRSAATQPGTGNPAKQDSVCKMYLDRGSVCGQSRVES